MGEINNFNQILLMVMLEEYGRSDAREMEILPKNESIEYQTIVFAWLLLAFQAAFIFIYGFLVFPQEVVKGTAGVSPQSLVSMVALLVLIGFGLYFSYLKNLSWTGIGFTLLIVSFTFQYYFLINGFWTHVGIFSALNPPYFSNSSPNNAILIYVAEEIAGTPYTFGATAVEALKCALAMTITFAGTQGRAGPLQALIIVLLGGFLYELNRQVINNYSTDNGGSMSVFQFAGFTSLGINLFLYFCRQRYMADNHPEIKASKTSVTWALIGCAFCWVFFPLLSANIFTSRISLQFMPFLAMETVWMAIAFCVCTSISFSLIIQGRIQVRSVVTASIAGAVFVGTSSNFTSSPFAAMFLGSLAAIFQTIFNLIDERLSRHGFMSNNVFFSFGLMGWLGGLASAAMRNFSTTSLGALFPFETYPLPYTLMSTNGQVSATFTTAGIALTTGLMVGGLLWLISSEDQMDMYRDSAYWEMGNDHMSPATQEYELQNTIQPDRGLASSAVIVSGHDIKNKNQVL